MERKVFNEMRCPTLENKNYYIYFITHKLVMCANCGSCTPNIFLKVINEQSCFNRMMLKNYKFYYTDHAN